MLKPGLLDILCCPADGGSLDLDTTSSTVDGIESGELICTECRVAYPVRNYIPRFVQSDGYVDSFTFEWDKHGRTQQAIDRRLTRETFQTRTGFAPEEINGKLLLDAGCGVGRYMKIALDQGAEVVAVDMSASVEQALVNVGLHPQAHIVQADSAQLPFIPSAFNHIFSLGVLHHMPQPAVAFGRLLPHLKPGGSIAISVYPQGRGIYEDAKRWRGITTRMSHRLLYALTSIASFFLYLLYRLPIIGSFAHYAPISMHPSYEWRRLDTFDAYSPRYASTHTYHEVYTWFRREGLRNMEVLPAQVSMRGWKSESA